MAINSMKMGFNKHKTFIQETAVRVPFVKFHFHITISCLFVSRVLNVKFHFQFINVVVFESNHVVLLTIVVLMPKPKVTPMGMTKW